MINSALVEFKRLKNVAEKGENAGSPQCFQQLL